MVHRRLPPKIPLSPPSRLETAVAALLFALSLIFFGWSLSVGWESKALPGHEYRQAQTALSTYWIKQEGNFSLAYPTPVLGKPWAIPMEFPLYQWTVVGLGRATGLGIVKSARLVSAACFLLTLPAAFLLLGRWRVAPGRRWLALALVTTCPLLVFYARAFLIETMALMFALWFWVAFEQAVARRHAGWLVLANIAALGAGLVKVTTLLLYLLPVAAWAAVRWWRGRSDGRWRGDLGWMAGALALPFAATVAWVRYADAVKAQNPVADFLGSVHMIDFNFGTTQLRLSSELWAMQFAIVRDRLTWWPLLIVTPLLFALGGRHRARAALHCALVLAAALAIFPILYAYHEYYHVTVAPALALAMGLTLIGLAETPRWRWLALTGAAIFTAAQAGWWALEFRPQQSYVSAGGDGVTDALRGCTQPRDVLVVAGQDWNSMTPYYAQRRALMLRVDAETDGPKLDRALAALADEHIGALVVSGDWRVRGDLRARLARMGLPAEPVLAWDGGWIFLPEAVAKSPEFVRRVSRGEWRGVGWAPGKEPPPQPLAGAWRNFAEMAAAQRALFDTMRPAPVRFCSSFEPQRQIVVHEPAFSVHPETRLVFRLAAGTRTLRAAVWFNPGAYTPPAGERATDGVELRVSALGVGEPRVLASRVIDPTADATERGPVPVEFRFQLPADGEIELLVGPGPAGRDTRDWAWLRGPLVIE